MTKPNPTSLTLLFKKRRVTVLLMLPPSGTIMTAKEGLLNALRSRGLTEIDGDRIPDNAADIELAIPVDKNDLAKGWTRLEADTLIDQQDVQNNKRNAGTKDTNTVSLQAADLRNGQPIAFRFRTTDSESAEQNGLESDLDLEDPGWDVTIPSLDDEEEPN